MERLPFMRASGLLRERITDFHRALRCAAPADAEGLHGSFVLERVIEISCNVIIARFLLGSPSRRRRRHRRVPSPRTHLIKNASRCLSRNSRAPGESLAGLFTVRHESDTLRSYARETERRMLRIHLAATKMSNSIGRNNETFLSSPAAREFSQVVNSRHGEPVDGKIRR